MVAIRNVFSGRRGSEGIPRGEAIGLVARRMGYRRAGARVRGVLHGAFATACKRAIVYTDRNVTFLLHRTIDDYPREDLKRYVRHAVGYTWVEEKDALRKAARFLGFSRVKSRIDGTLRSIVRGLVIQGYVEKRHGWVRRITR